MCNVSLSFMCSGLPFALDSAIGQKYKGRRLLVDRYKGRSLFPKVENIKVDRGDGLDLANCGVLKAGTLVVRRTKRS